MLENIVFLGAAINLAGSSLYIKGTLQGKVKPNRVSFLLWGVAPLIGGAAALSSGVQLAVIPVLFAGIIPLLIFAASFVNKKAYWKLESFDYICGLFSVLALILWAITKEPITAIIFAVIGDGFAAIPTIKKAWNHPETEMAIAFVASLVSQFTVFFAMQSFSFSELAFPIYLITANSIIIFAIYRKRILKAMQSI